MTTIRVGPLSRPRGGSIQWQGDGAGAVLLRGEFFGAAPAGIEGQLSATLANAGASSASSTSKLGVRQSVVAGGATADSTTTGAITTLAGATLLVFVHWQDTASAPTVTDSKGNTWSQVGSTVSPSGGSFSQHFAAFKCEAATTGASHTFTASKTGAFTSVYVVELTGGAVAFGNSASQASGPYSSGSVSPAGDALLIALGAVEGAGTTSFTPGGGFAEIATINDFAFWQGQTAYRQVGAGTYTASFTTANAADGGAIVLVATEAAGGIAGTLSATLGAATLSSTGSTRIAGTASQTLAATTLASTATLRIAGTLSATLGTATLSAQSGLRVAGTLSQTLGTATLASASTLQIASTLSVTLADATLAATATVVSAGTIAGEVAATLSDATLDAAATLAGSEPAGPTPAGRGSNLRNVWTFKDAPFEVRTPKRRKRYKTAQAATTAIREAAKAGEVVEFVVRGEPVNLPTLETASYAEVFARIEVAERVQQAEAKEAKARRLLETERDDEEALVLALVRLWRL